MVNLSRRDMLAVSGAALLAACSGRAGQGGLTIGFQKNGLLLLAQSRGQVTARFAAEGKPPPTWVEFPSGPPMMEAMAAGSLDFGAVGESPPIFAQAAGQPIRYVAVQPLSGQGAAIVVPPASSIRAIADLKGRKVAFVKGSSAHLVTAKALEKAGLDFADIDVAYLNPADAAGALASGAIDAWAIWDPFLAIAQAQQGARAIVTGADLPPSDAFFVGSAAATETKADYLHILLKALREEAAWAARNPKEAVAIVAKQSGLPAQIVATSLRRGRFAAEPMAAQTTARQQSNADLFAKLGIIAKPVSIEAAVWHDSVKG
ncbi:MAG: aliphatic sulfonate ABC transporter substrate-binding protein [Sphingobium sp.]